jgi:hypothetical protein
MKALIPQEKPPAYRQFFSLDDKLFSNSSPSIGKAPALLPA